MKKYQKCPRCGGRLKLSAPSLLTEGRMIDGSPRYRHYRCAKCGNMLTKDEVGGTDDFYS